MEAALDIQLAELIDHSKSRNNVSKCMKPFKWEGVQAILLLKNY